MANQEHLEILAKGVETWNTWRKKNRYIRPDLAGAHLYGRNLTGVNFESCDLQRVNLEHSILVGANLRLAYLHRSSARGIDLTSATLYGTDCGVADLESATLASAYLDTTN